MVYRQRKGYHRKVWIQYWACKISTSNKLWNCMSGHAYEMLKEK